VLNKGALVLEGVTLAGVVQLVVKVLVDLAGGTVLDEHAAEHTHAAHPEDLGGHTGVGGTLSLTVAGVTTSTAGSLKLAGPAAGVHGVRLLDDQTVRDELADGLAYMRPLSADIRATDIIGFTNGSWRSRSRSSRWGRARPFSFHSP
jgi:hypothetical protein